MTQTLTRAGFDLDLRIGEKAEGDLGRILAAKDPLIECKCDLGCQRYRGGKGTGNVFVEYEQPDRHSGGHKASGIAITQAGWWAEGLQDGTWVIVPTEKMRYLVSVARERGLVRAGGDYDNYHGVLVPARWLLEYVKRRAPD